MYSSNYVCVYAPWYVYGGHASYFVCLYGRGCHNIFQGHSW